MHLHNEDHQSFSWKQRMWQPIQTSQKHDHSLKPISKTAHNILRPESHVRETKGAENWPKVMRRIDDLHPKTRSWNFDQWFDALLDAPDRVRIEYCLDPHGERQYIRAMQGHRGVPRVDPTFFTLLEIPYEWKVHSYHTESYRSIVEGGLIAGGTSDRRARHTCFSAMDPLEEPFRCYRILYERTSNGAPQNIQNDQITMQCTSLI